MNKKEIIRAAWERRDNEDPAWFDKNYAQAIDRIEDHTDDEDNPYWLGPDSAWEAERGGRLIDVSGGGEDFSPDDARRQAFELLVLADLMEGVE